MEEFDYNVVALFLGELFHHIGHLLGTLLENVVAISLRVGLQVVRQPLQITLLLLALQVQIVLCLGAEFAAG